MSVTTSAVVVMTDEHKSKLEQVAKAGNQSEQDLLSEVLSNALAEIINGGLVVPAKDVARISRFVSKEVSSGKVLVDLIDRAIGRRGDNLVLTYELDAVYERAFSEIAMRTGRSVQQLFSSIVNLSIHEQFLQMNLTDAIQIAITPEQHKQLVTMTGKECFTGADVMNLLLSGESEPELVEAVSSEK